jgi:hypothetical protein
VPPLAAVLASASDIGPDVRDRGLRSRGILPSPQFAPILSSTERGGLRESHSGAPWRGYRGAVLTHQVIVGQAKA